MILARMPALPLLFLLFLICSIPGLSKQDLAAADEAVDSCSCLQPADPSFRTGVVWRGKAANLRLQDIALMLAPALWFSSDEPLITHSEGPIPQAHPCDRSSDKPVVYYQATRINLRGDVKVTSPEEEDPDFFVKVNSLTIRYFFYYPEDIGMHSHTHDLEGAEFQIDLERSEHGCDQVRLTEVIGLAHGIDWYDNRLQVEQDTKFPVMLLVEKGKHASCPDRNADGVYVRGYDVNLAMNNAWGLRDGWGTSRVLTTIFLFGMRPSAPRMKPRDPTFRVLPPESDLTCIPERYNWLDADSKFMGRYELRPASSVPACEETLFRGQNLLGLMRQNHFGVEYPATQSRVDSLRERSDRLSYTGLLPPVSVRLDGDLGLSFVLPGWEYRQKYFLPKINWYGREMSLEALVTPTASQFFSWYATAGIDGTYLKENLRFVDEFGIKVRFGLSGKSRGLFGMGYRFAGVRVGLRNSGLKHMKTQILVEVGAGVW